VSVEAIGQAIGLVTVIPLCSLLALMLWVPARAFVMGGVRERYLAILVGAVGLRVADDLEVVEPEDIARFRTLVAEYRSAIETETIEKVRIDATVAAFAGRQTDADFEPEFSVARDACQRVALSRLGRSCGNTPSLHRLVRWWRPWAAREQTRLYYAGLRRAGRDVVWHVASSTGTATLVTAAGGIFCSLVAWIWTLSERPSLLDYVEAGGTVGALVGFAAGVVRVGRDAWQPFMSIIPEDSRRPTRRAFAVFLVLSALIGPFIYFRVPGVAMDWIAGQVGTWDVDDTIPAAIAFALFVGYLLLLATNAARSALVRGERLSERLDNLGLAIFVSLLALFGAVAAVNAYIARIPATGSAALGWIAVAAVTGAGLLGVASWMARQWERRRRIQRFRDMGLSPRRIAPPWVVAVGWIVGTLALGYVGFLVAPRVLIALDRGQDQDAIAVAGYGLLGLFFLCCVLGTCHVAITWRRRQRDERRLVEEARHWLRGTQDEGTADAGAYSETGFGDEQKRQVESVHTRRRVGEADLAGSVSATKPPGERRTNYDDDRAGGRATAPTTRDELEAVRLVDGRSTAGTYAVVRYTVPPKRLMPVYVHSREDVVSYVLAGNVVVLVDDEARTVTEGVFAVRPAGYAHALWNASDRPAVLLEVVAPPGFDEFFDELASLGSPPRSRAADELEALRGRYGLVYDAERVAALESMFGLRSIDG
jgi:quercetin dioxygenase-like cupin family protein